MEKQLVMVGFLLELGYDLIINNDDNVSKSPGFEPYLGIFGGEKWGLQDHACISTIYLFDDVRRYESMTMYIGCTYISVNDA